MTLALAVLGLITALVPVFIWYLKKHDEPPDLDSDTAQLAREIEAARRAGDDARADALLRRLRDLAVQPSRAAETIDQRDGERDRGDAAGGDNAQHP